MGDITTRQILLVKRINKTSGQLNPIILDQYGNVVDGHNRLKILTDLRIEPIFQVKHFKDDFLHWILL